MHALIVKRLILVNLLVPAVKRWGETDFDKGWHVDLLCESFSCHFRYSRMFDEAWVARERREETRLVR